MISISLKNDLTNNKEKGKWYSDECQTTLFEDDKFTKFTRVINGQVLSEYGPQINRINTGLKTTILCLMT
jgi:hypothetical protein